MVYIILLHLIRVGVKDWSLLLGGYEGCWNRNVLMGELWINQTVGTVTVLVMVIGFYLKSVNKGSERKI